MEKKMVPWRDYESGEIVMITEDAYNAIMREREKLNEYIRAKTNLEGKFFSIQISSTMADDSDNSSFYELWNKSNS